MAFTLKPRTLKKKPVAALVSLALLFSGIIGLSVPASATTKTLTVVSTGGAAVGTGWTFTAGTPAVIAATADVSINASDIVAYFADNTVTALEVQADAISVTANVVHATNKALTLKATGNINVTGGVTIQSTGGDLVFHSDSDNNAVGSIRLGNHLDNNTGQINSIGGKIVFGGGTNPETDDAMASTDLSDDPGSGPDKPKSGFASYGFAISAGGGNITARGGSGARTDSTRAVLIESNAAGRTSFATSGAGTVSIYGDGSTINFDNPWGVAVNGLNITTSQGNVLLSGISNPARSNVRGLALYNFTISSTSGNVTIEDRTNGTAANYSGTVVGGTSPSISTTSGNILIAVDEYVPDGNPTVTLSGVSVALEPYTGTSFTAALSTGILNASSSSDLRLGESGNTANITLSGAVSAGGNLTIHSSGTVSQSAAVTASGLSLNGAGAFTLTNASNNVATLSGGTSASRIGNVSFTDISGGLEIGTVNSQTGLYSSGTIDVATTAGNLTLSQPVSSSLASGDSMKLYANKSEVAGNAGNGNVIVSGSGAIASEVGARALIYSGSRPDSTGLITAVGGSANTRSLVAATTNLATVSPAIASTGKFALFRTDVPSTEQEQEAAPAPTSTPVLAAVDINPRKVTVKNEIITITGANLGTVTEVYIGGIKATIFSQSGNRLQVRAPQGLKGLVDLELKSSLNDVLLAKYLSFGEQTQAGVVRTRSNVSGFAPFSSKLTKEMRIQIRQMLKANPDATKLTCTGYTSAPFGAGDQALANRRGLVACEYAKKKRPQLSLSISRGIQDPRPGEDVRRVKLVFGP